LTRKVRWQRWTCTQKPLSIRSRKIVPSASLLRLSSPSVISTIAINFPRWQNEDKNLAHLRPAPG